MSHANQAIVAGITILATVLVDHHGLAEQSEGLPPRPESVVVDTKAQFVAAPSRPYSFEAAARASFITPPIRGGVNPFGGGFGGRLGLDLWSVYVGASVTSFLGGSDVGATDQAVLAGVEIGYSARLGRCFTLRPLLGVGDTILSHTEPGTGGTVDVVSSASGGSSSTTTGGTAAVTTTVKNIYLEPDLTAIFEYRRFFAAIGFGVMVIPGILYGPSPAETTTWISYSFETQLGFRL